MPVARTRYLHPTRLCRTLRNCDEKSDPLGLGVGEFYSRLVTGMLSTEKVGSHTPGPVPTFSALQPWLDKIKDPALACMTAQRVAAGMARYLFIFLLVCIMSYSSVRVRFSMLDFSTAEGGECNVGGS